MTQCSRELFNCQNKAHVQDVVEINTASEAVASCTGYVQPWWFTGHCEEDNYRKTTGLKCLNGAQMPEKYVKEGLPAPDDRIHKAPPGPDRANFRSATPKGMAQAIYLANKHLVGDV